MSLQDNIDKLVVVANTSIETPWDTLGITADKFLKDFTEDCNHLTKSLKGEVKYRGMKAGSIAKVSVQALQLVRWVVVQKELSTLKTIAVQERLKLAQRERNSATRKHNMGLTISSRTDTG